jgi:outer membrane lipoprotein-sorting protein
MSGRCGALALVLVAACARAPEGDPAVAAAVQKALAARLQKVHDYRVSGVVEDVTSKERLAFTYAMKQPGFMKATLGDTRAFVYDGKTLAVHDAPSKVALQRDLGTLDEPSQLMLLHDTFGDFVCEGWRPPLLKPRGFTARVEGDRFIVTVPIDDGTVAEQRLVLRQSDGAFLEKSLRDKSGRSLSTTRVVEELQADGLAFPRVWEREDASGKYRVVLEKAEVNVGINADEFSTRPPEGYTVQ